MIEDNNKNIEHETEENAKSFNDNENTISFTRKIRINLTNPLIMFTLFGTAHFMCLLWLINSFPRSEDSKYVPAGLIEIVSFSLLLPLASSLIFIINHFWVRVEDKRIFNRDRWSRERYDLLFQLKELDKPALTESVSGWNDGLFDTAQLVADTDVMIEDCTINVESLKAYALAYEELGALAPTVKY